MPAPDPSGQPPPRSAACAVVSALAILGAGALQFTWSEIFGPGQPSSRWHLAVLLAATTAYLLATAWFHASLVRRPPARGSFAALVGDLILGATAGALLAAGHETALLRQGLWLVAPILLAVCAGSAVAGGFALRQGGSLRRVSDSVGWWRASLAAVVVVILATLR